MKLIGEKLKQVNRESIVASVIAVVLGFMMILFSNTASDIISYLIGGILIIRGIVKMYFYFKYQGGYNVYNYDLSFGIFNIIFGILCIIFKSEFQSIFRILIGIFVIYEGILKISLSTRLYYIDSGVGFLSFLLSIIIILCGVFVIFNEGIVITTIGYTLIIFSIMNIIESIIFNRNLNKLEKYLKEKIDL